MHASLKKSLKTKITNWNKNHILKQDCESNGKHSFSCAACCCAAVVVGSASVRRSAAARDRLTVAVDPTYSPARSERSSYVGVISASSTREH